jgi:hypothetical protein
MELKLVDYTLSHPVERVRGGPIVVQLDVQWSKNTPAEDGRAMSKVEFITVPGISVIADGPTLTDELLGEGIQRALDFSRQQALKLIEATPLVGGAGGEAVARLLLTRNKEKNRPALTGKLEGLDGPANESHQRTVDGVCETLGITKINVLDMTVLEAVAVLEELQNVTKNLTQVGD